MFEPHESAKGTESFPPRLVAIGMGSNLGESLDILRKACAALDELPGSRFHQVSRVRLTRAILGCDDMLRDGKSDPFLNAVAILETSLPPRELLDYLLAIEHKFGRKRTKHWAPRTLDLDILLDEAGPYCDERLLIPHPRLGSRLFFLACLEELLPDWRHPWCDLTIRGMVEVLSTRPPYFLIAWDTFIPSTSGQMIPMQLFFEAVFCKKFVPEKQASPSEHRPDKPIFDFSYHCKPPWSPTDIRQRLEHGYPVYESVYLTEDDEQGSETAGNDLPTPCLIFLGPGAKGALWRLDPQDPRHEAGDSALKLPDLSRLRASAIPVVFVEGGDMLTWADQIIAGFEASQESGRVLGDLI